MSEIDCKRCKRIAPVSEFIADARYVRGYGSWCRDCHKEHKATWRTKNRAAEAERTAKWRRENPETARATWQAFHERNKDARAASFSEWSKKNRDKRRAASAARKAAKIRATPPWVNWKKVRAIYREAQRLQELTGVPMHVDHIVPLQGKTVCGLHWEGNLRVITASENCSKFNRLIEECDL